jgi:Zn-dependent protease
MPGSIRVARVAGIPIGIHPLWFAVVALITWSLGEAYYPEVIGGIAPLAAYALGLASALLLFASILLHELGHALVARRFGIRIDEIDLWLLGGVAVMRDGARRPGEELRFALAGPAVTVVVAIVCGALALLLSYTQLTAAQALLEYQAVVNVAIVAFNLLPAFPLDGGRVARAVLWSRKGDKVAATAVAAAVGRAFAVGFIALGAIAIAAGVPTGFWFALIGLFLLLASRAELQQARIQEIFAGRRAEQLISHPAVVLPGDLTVEEAIRDYFVPLGYTAFPVADLSGRPLGLLSLATVHRVPAARRSSVSVADLADRNPDLFVGRDEDVTEVLGRPAFVRVGRAIVVGPSGEASGLLSITDVERAVRATVLAPGGNGSRADARPVGSAKR